METVSDILQDKKVICDHGSNFLMLKIKNNRKMDASDRQDWLISLHTANTV